MPFQRLTTHRESVQAVSIFATLFCLAWLAALTTLCLCAQTPTAQGPPSTSPDDHPYTLRVYSRLVQLPTLVLSRDRTQLPPIDPQKFNVSLDDGPRFHATHIRREGDDPITLAILLDVSGDQSDLLPAFSRSFSTWISSSLTPQDRISIYAVDCAMLQTSAFAPPSDPNLQKDLDTAIHSTKTHGSKNHSACRSTLNLRDAVVVVMQQIASLPGRLVLLVVTDGYDGGSSVTPSALRFAATSNSVTIFGLANPGSIYFQHEAQFKNLVESSGGTYLESVPSKLPKALSDFIAMLRGRYILEFPTPANDTPGHHDIRITIDHTKAFITTSGFTLARDNPADDNDPTTIKNDNPNAPILGKHRPSSNPQP
jgi:hypothetical protein